MTDQKNALPIGTVLDNRYRIEAVLGAGGFGMVYKAVHTRLDKVCAIKEYLPQEVAVREGTTVHPLSTNARADYEDGLARFLREAKQLVQFSGHRNIVTCNDFIEANGTAYLVMDFEEGMTLSALLARREDQGRPLEQDEILRLLRPLLEGLAYVHGQDVLHRDIKPGNIFIRRSDEQPVLLDFGAAKEEFSQKSKSQAAHTPGYAATEQVESAGNLGPWTDIYAVGGILYRALTGNPPPDVQDRLSATVRGRPDPLALDNVATGDRFSPGYVDLIRACMTVNEEDRIQSVADLLTRIDDLERAPMDASSATQSSSEQASSKREPVSVPDVIQPGESETTNSSVPPSVRKSRKPLWIAAAVLLVLVVGAGALAWPTYQEYQEYQRQALIAATEAALRADSLDEAEALLDELVERGDVDQSKTEALNDALVNRREQVEAEQRRQAAIDALIDDTETALASGALEEAEEFLDELAGHDADRPEITALTNALTEERQRRAEAAAQRQRQMAIENRIASTEAALAAGALNEAETLLDELGDLAVDDTTMAELREELANERERKAAREAERREEERRQQALSEAEAASLAKRYYDRRSEWAGQYIMGTVTNIRLVRQTSDRVRAHIRYRYECTIHECSGTQDTGYDQRQFDYQRGSNGWRIVDMGDYMSGSP
ncbi:MAG: protein kinase [Spiribacter salinus]|uniref:Protein kinase n=1 Tax=Spiribacter salinus TaxID=1335746 RepID=A0A540VQA1_9GAMM|nr:MAG: protein kinase [Spiribacter salinus]